MTAFGGVQSATLTEAAFSPDGRWVAYQSRETTAGTPLQVFLQPFPSTGAKYLVPQVGGHPFWSRKGDELMLNTSPISSRVIAVTTTPRVEFGRPEEFARVGRLEPNPSTDRRNVDAMPDGQHVIGVTSLSLGDAGASLATQVNVVLNWFDEVRQRVPVK